MHIFHICTWFLKDLIVILTNDNKKISLSRNVYKIKYILQMGSIERFKYEGLSKTSYTVYMKLKSFEYINEILNISKISYFQATY